MWVARCLHPGEHVREELDPHINRSPTIPNPMILRFLSESQCGGRSRAPRLGDGEEANVGSVTDRRRLRVRGWLGRLGRSAGLFRRIWARSLRSGLTRRAAAPQMVVMGRRTYELLAGLPEEFRDEGWHRMSQRRHGGVLADTHAGQLAEHAPVQWPSGRRGPGHERRWGGPPSQRWGVSPWLDSSSMRGLVDRLRLMIFPLIAGPRGREAAFQDIGSADLELVDHQALDGRVLLVEYRPTGKDIPRA